MVQHLPPPRRPALSELADYIIAAEVARMRCTDTVRRLRTLDEPSRLERNMLRLAEERLKQLRRSQVTLSAGATVGSATQRMGRAEHAHAPAGCTGDTLLHPSAFERC
jgi:hypothetical protein